jgi:hypothetical protein
MCAPFGASPCTTTRTRRARTHLICNFSRCLRPAKLRACTGNPVYVSSLYTICQPVHRLTVSLIRAGCARCLHYAKAYVLVQLACCNSVERTASLPSRGVHVADSLALLMQMGVSRRMVWKEAQVLLLLALASCETLLVASSRVNLGATPQATQQGDDLSVMPDGLDSVTANRNLLQGDPLSLTVLGVLAALGATLGQ